jgi:protein-disulfide isomerase
VFGILTAAGAYALTVFHEAKQQAQSGGIAAKVVKEYYSLPTVQAPSLVSPYWIVKATDRFEDAPVHVIEYVDFRCPDCLYLNQQLDKLKAEFKGKLNIAFQFFPLEAKCNTVVEKNLHPGACDLAYIAAYDPARFVQIHDEIFASFQEGKKPEWRAALASKYGVEAALTDQKTKDLVARIIRTGAEYEKTSEKFSHGIRSTPTMIVNNRMIIGTLPYVQLRAIFQSLVEEQGGPKKFIENWVPRK